MANGSEVRWLNVALVVAAVFFLVAIGGVVAYYSVLAPRIGWTCGADPDTPWGGTVRGHCEFSNTGARRGDLCGRMRVHPEGAPEPASTSPRICAGPLAPGDSVSVPFTLETELCLAPGVERCDWAFVKD